MIDSRDRFDNDWPVVVEMIDSTFKNVANIREN